jgi:serine/threonine protein phosphatase PrpC
MLEIPVELEGTLTVNADARTLWRNTPSDSNGRYAKPDDESKSILKDGLIAVGASRRGRSHAHEGKYRDDDFGFRYLDGSGWWLLAVADGAGSASLSRRGSQIAICEALAKLEKFLVANADDSFFDAVRRVKAGDAAARNHLLRTLYDTLVRAAYAAASAIQSEASQQGEPVREFASTLLLAAYRKVDEFHFFAGFGIGDGGIALLRLDDNEVIPLSLPDGGEFAGQTRFLTTAEFAAAESSMSRLHLRCVDRFTALVLMTDGVSDPKLESDEKLGDCLRWREIWERDLSPILNSYSADAEAGARLLGWLDFYTPNNHDDRTLALLMPVKP